MFRRPVFWATFAAFAGACAAFAVANFPRAFSIVELDLEMDRATALSAARRLADELDWGPAGYRQAASFRVDDRVRSFVELEGGRPRRVRRAAGRRAVPPLPVGRPALSRGRGARGGGPLPSRRRALRVSRAAVRGRAGGRAGPGSCPHHRGGRERRPVERRARALRAGGGIPGRAPRRAGRSHVRLRADRRTGRGRPLPSASGRQRRPPDRAHAPAADPRGLRPPLRGDALGQRGHHHRQQLRDAPHLRRRRHRRRAVRAAPPAAGAVAHAPRLGRVDRLRAASGRTEPVAAAVDGLRHGDFRNRALRSSR